MLSEEDINAVLGKMSLKELYSVMGGKSLLPISIIEDKGNYQYYPDKTTRALVMEEY
jgi:hypothetical protein